MDDNDVNEGLRGANVPMVLRRKRVPLWLALVMMAAVTGVSVAIVYVYTNELRQTATVTGGLLLTGTIPAVWQGGANQVFATFVKNTNAIGGKTYDVYSFVNITGTGNSGDWTVSIAGGPTVATCVALMCEYSTTSHWSIAAQQSFEIDIGMTPSVAGSYTIVVVARGT